MDESAKAGASLDPVNEDVENSDDDDAIQVPNVGDVDQMEEAGEDDPEGLDFQLQQLLLAFYNVAAEMGKSQEFAAAGYKRMQKVAQDAQKAKSGEGSRPSTSGEGQPKKRDAGESLLFCIKKVCEMGQKARVQELLQNFMIEFLSPPENNMVVLA